MSRFLLKAGVAVLVALAAGLGIGIGLQVSGMRWPGTAAPPPRATGPTPAEIQRAFVGVADHLRPAVVNIATAHFLRRQRPRGSAPGGTPPTLKDYFDQYFGQMPPGERERSGVGSGVIIDAQGHILTNLHVIKGADEITVRFQNKKEVAGKIVGTDATTDLAVIRIPVGEGVVAAKLGDSDRIEVGEWVDRDRQPLRARADGHRRRRERDGPVGGRDAPTRTSSRRTRPSIPGTPAARCSTPWAR